jgi:hypothetical protein
MVRHLIEIDLVPLEVFLFAERTNDKSSHAALP